MHQLIADVLPYFVALYVLDSLAFARAHELVFLRAWRVFGVQRHSVVLAGLAPHSEAIACVELPLRLGTQAIGWPADGGFTPVSWDDLGAVEVDQRSVSCAGGRTLRLSSAEAAQHVARTLTALREAPAASRRARADALSDSATDLTAIRDVRARHQRHASLLGALGAVLGVGWFGLLPAAVFGPWSGKGTLYVLAALLVVHVAVCVLAWRTLRACGVAPGPALGTLSTFAFLLPAAVHARFVLGRLLYVRFDPLALAAVLLPAEDFRAHARREFHRNRLEGVAWPAFADHTSLRERAWRRVVLAAGLNPEEVLRAPRPEDAHAVAYCPLCALEYRAGFASCSDCQAPLESLRTEAPA